MNDHISKPIDPSALFETVARYYRSAPGTSASVPAMAKSSDPVVKTAGIPMAESRADEMEIPTVEGLDSAEGLLRVAGNRKLYLKLLRQFSAQQSDAPVQITELLKAGDRPAAERTAHTVKGVAGESWREDSAVGGG